jgi:RNA polymerase sigma-70 factor (ECF subfamily)
MTTSETRSGLPPRDPATPPSGRADWLRDLTPQLYDQVRAIAQSQLRHERAGHTLQATALANEAIAKLAVQDEARIRGDNHFLAVASEAIRRVLVDHARGRSRKKRGGERQRVSLDRAECVAEADSPDVVAIDAALERLARIFPRQAKVVELKVFGGLSTARTALILSVSERTVEEDWALARAWLRAQMEREP